MNNFLRSFTISAHSYIQPMHSNQVRYHTEVAGNYPWRFHDHMRYALGWSEKYDFEWSRRVFPHPSIQFYLNAVWCEQSEHQEKSGSPSSARGSEGFLNKAAFPLTFKTLWNGALRRTRCVLHWSSITLSECMYIELTVTERRRCHHNWCLGCRAKKVSSTVRLLRPNTERSSPSDCMFRILHIGCGSSQMSMQLYNMGYKNITNVDYSKVPITENW